LTRRRNTQDEELRRLERVWRDSESDADRIRYATALLRAGRPEAAFIIDPLNVESAREAFRILFATGEDGSPGMDLDDALRWWWTHVLPTIPRWKKKDEHATLSAIKAVTTTAFEALRGRWQPEIPSPRTGAERHRGERVGGILSAEIPNTWPERIHGDTDLAADTIVFTRLAAQAASLEQAAGAPRHDWPRWIQLNYDTDGLWYSPGDREFLEYIDLDHGANEPGILVERGAVTAFDLGDFLHSGLDDPADPVLLRTALDAAQFEEARRSRWAEDLVFEAAWDLRSHRGYGGGPIALFISESDIARLNASGQAIPGTRYQMRDDPTEPPSATESEEMVVRATAYAIRHGVQNRDGVRVAWRNWSQSEDGEWEFEEREVNDMLIEFLRGLGVDA